MFKEMTLEQLQEIIEFVEKYHNFSRYIPTCQRLVNKDGNHFRLAIKYVNFHYDTRSQGVWAVEFKGLGLNLIFRTNEFLPTDNESEMNLVPYDNLYDWIMAYLKGEWSDEKIMKKMYFNP